MYPSDWFISMLLIVFSLLTGICCSIAPVIRIWPHWKLRRVKGSNLQMKCIVNTSKPPISMKWLFISVDRNDTLACTKGSNSISLSIKKLKVLDAGAYICVVKLADGKVFTEVAVVFIVDKEMTGLCNEHQFVCKETRVCISKKFLCNRVDDCRDKSDEKDCIVPEPTYAVTKHPDTELGGQTIFVQTAVYSVIGCTIGIILLISVLIIAVFRIRMKRAAVRRAMAPADLANRGNAMPPPGAPPMVPGSHPVPPEYDPFLSPSNQQSQYGNIIVNVNNGVQYVPGSEFPSYIEPPPPYSTVVAGRECSPPPPYSTIDRSAPAAATTSSSVSAAASSSAAAAIPPPQPPPPAHSEPERSPPLLTPPILSDPTQAGELPRAHPPELSSVTTNLLPSCSTDGQLTHPLPGHIIVKDGKIILTPKNS